MTIFNKIKVIALSVGLALPVAAHADINLSFSNQPAPDIERHMAQLFAFEQASMDALEADTVARVLANFKPTTKPTPPVRVEYSRSFLAGVPAASGDDNWKCLAQALYFEARGETVEGQFAVAEVIMNRVKSSAFPNSLCGVINQGTGRKYQCQFTYTCDGRAENITEPAAWSRVGKIARLIIDGAPLRLTQGATHYHTKAVNPNWSRVFARTASIGVHHFYRMPRA
jgi:hypothetical protein